MATEKPPEVLTMMEILEEAILREKDAYDYYQHAATVAIKPSAKKVLLSLADREKGHMAEICALLTEVKAQMEIDRAITGGANPLC
jgi:rubrerythrin